MLAALLLVVARPAQAQQIDPDLLHRDSLIAGSQSQDFITASLLVITPGDEIYSAFGHTALRMQCPSKGLDYCFSFQTDESWAGYLAFMAGQSNAGFVPILTSEFLPPYRRDGRGITQYALNLTPQEKQELWRNLDQDMLQGSYRKFNLLQNNCASMSDYKLEEILGKFGEEIVVNQWPQAHSLINGEGVKWLSRRRPWAQVVFMTFMGTEADIYWPQEQRLSPELIASVLQHSVIRPYGETSGTSSRPVLTGQQQQIMPCRNAYDASHEWFTPTVAGIAVLALTLLIAALLMRHPKRCLATRVLAWAGAVAYLLFSLFLLYVTLVSGLFGTHWNWLLLPFNPLPLLLWLIGRHKAWRWRLWAGCAVVLVAFVVIVPFVTCQLLPFHYLVAASLAVICAAKARLAKCDKG